MILHVGFMKLDSFWKCKDGSMHTNLSMWCTTLTKGKIKTMSVDKKHSTKFSVYSWFKKTPTEVDIEGTYLFNTIHLQQTLCQHSIQWWKAESFPAKFRNKTGMPTLTSSIQHVIGSPGNSSQIRKINKYPDWKGRGRTVTVCRWHDAL